MAPHHRGPFGRILGVVTLPGKRPRPVIDTPHILHISLIIVLDFVLLASSRDGRNVPSFVENILGRPHVRIVFKRHAGPAVAVVNYLKHGVVAGHRCRRAISIRVIARRNANRKAAQKKRHGQRHRGCFHGSVARIYPHGFLQYAWGSNMNHFGNGKDGGEVREPLNKDNDS